MPSPSLLSRRSAAVLSGAVLLLASCSGGEEEPILAPTVHASFAQGVPPVSDRVVFFSNITTVGDAITLDVRIQDSTGTLDMDDVDLVLRYDATFIQVSGLSGQDTLFGSCGTVNPVCGVTSPICLDNRTQANGGGEAFCRSDGSTFCSTNADCPTPGDACGSFGRLEASFAVLTGPKVCSNNPNQACAQSSNCQFCTANPAAPCTDASDCSGSCVAGFCTNLPTRPCATDTECIDLCGSGTCQGCPSVIVSGSRKIATLTLRVMRAGTGDFRFVVPSGAGTSGSAVRKDAAELDPPVLFFPSVDAGDPASKNGTIVITGTL